MKAVCKRGLCMCIAGTMLLALSGCGGKFPDLTDEQYNHVVEYASGLLLKYSNNGVKKMTYLEPTQPVEGVDALPDDVGMPEAAPPDTPESPQVALLPEDANALPEMPDLSELPEEEEADVPAGEAVAVTQGDAQKLLNGLEVGYNGYAVYNYYPLEMADVIISAELGDKLLVLSFFVENPTDEELDIDMVVEDPVFRRAINHVEQGRYRPTILEDD